jgi:hypothetical protein
MDPEFVEKEDDALIQCRRHGSASECPTECLNDNNAYNICCLLVCYAMYIRT